MRTSFLVRVAEYGKEKMELEGFGASLVGRAIYVVADSEHAWIPWEFISGTAYNARILVTGEGPGVRLVEAENTWTAIFRPACARDWSCLATLVKAGGTSVLLAFDSHAPALPPGFVTFLDSVLAEGRILLTRIWIGTHVEIPAIPDALLFPPLRDSHRVQAAYDMMARLPARGTHGTWSALSHAEWNAMASATAAQDLGIVMSDVGESRWSLFWHKVVDSASESHGSALKKGLAWLRTGSLMIEKNHGGNK